MDQEKVTQSGEMEIDLLELLHLLRQKIWIVLPPCWPAVF